MKKFILFISLVFIILACGGTTPEPTATPIPEPTATPIPEPTATPMPEPTATATPIPVTLEDPIPSEVIYKEFLDNEYSAVKKYSGGYFYTQGKIMLMGFSGENPYIALDIPNVYETKFFLEEFLYCLISDEKNMDLIKINDTALVKARYENKEKNDILDYENIPWLTLIDCQIVDFKEGSEVPEVSEGPVGPISDKDLIDEFIENSTKATNKYSDKDSIKISGKINFTYFEDSKFKDMYIKYRVLTFDNLGTTINCTLLNNFDNDKYFMGRVDLGFKDGIGTNIYPRKNVILEGKFDNYSPNSPNEEGKINFKLCNILSMD